MDVRDALTDEARRHGRSSRVVLTPDAGVKPVKPFTGDGGYQARHPGEITEQP